MGNKITTIPSISQTKDRENLVVLAQNAVNAFAQGQIPAFTMTVSEGEISLFADSPDGNRVLMKKKQTAGVTKDSKTNIPKPKNMKERLQRVVEYRKQGMTQQEIAVYTRTSQKTVSNDIRRLREQGVL